jgi:Ni/Co efflux regulator RcnB
MYKLILPAAAAFVLSLGAAAAQTETQQTTTVQSSPDTQTTTTTTERNDGYGTYRKTVTSTRRYDAGTFVAPSGYTYTRYSIGERVPQVLIGSPKLVLDDYSTYRLDSPPEGLEWIRVGNDALLISRATGEVIQTDYDLFE